MIIKWFFSCIFLITISSSHAQNNVKLTSDEQANSVFHKFLTYIKNGNNENIDSLNNYKIDFLLQNYLLAIDYSSDTLKQDQKVTQISDEINSLKTFINHCDIDNIVLQRLGLLKDKYVYTKLSLYQQANTYVFFDKKFPEKILGYILFIPGTQTQSRSPRILSWKLVYSYGTYFFEDILGQKGTEAFFEGIKTPSNPVSL